MGSADKSLMGHDKLVMIYGDGIVQKAHDVESYLARHRCYLFDWGVETLCIAIRAAVRFCAGDPDVIDEGDVAVKLEHISSSLADLSWLIRDAEEGVLDHAGAYELRERCGYLSNCIWQCRRMDGKPVPEWF